MKPTWVTRPPTHTSVGHAAGGLALPTARRLVPRRVICDGVTSVGGRIDVGYSVDEQSSGALINVGGDSGMTVAAQRDGTSTASTSQHDPPLSNGSAAAAAARRAAILRAASEKARASSATLSARRVATGKVGPAAPETSAKEGTQPSSRPAHANAASVSTVSGNGTGPASASDVDSHHSETTTISSPIATAAAPSAAATDAATAAAAAAATPPTSEPAAPWVPPVHDSDYEVYLEIKACDTWRDVLDVVADEAATFTARTATQALTRLQKLTDRQPDAAAALSHPAYALLLAAFGATVGSMNPVQLSNCLYSLARLRGPPLTAALWAAHCAAVAKTASTFYPRDISTIFHAYSTMKLSPGQSVLDKLGFRAKMLLDKHEFEPQGISMLLSACVHVGYRNSMLLAAATSAATQALPQSSPQSVANCAWALQRLEQQDNQFLAQCKQFAVDNAARFNPQEAANLLYAFTQQRYHPQEALGALTLQCLAPRVSSLRPADLSGLLTCMSTFNVHPGEELMAKLCSRLEAQVYLCSRSELTQALRALGLMAETQQPVFKVLAARVTELFQRDDLADEGLLRQVFQALIASKLADEEPIDFPAPMLDEMKRAWMSSIHTGAAADAEEYANSRHGAQTRLQQLHDILMALKVPHDIRRPSQDGLVSIDVAIQAGRGRFVALQLLNEEEHTVNTQQVVGAVQLQRQVLERNGWEVRFLLARDLRAVAPLMRPQFIAELLRTAGVRVAVVPNGPMDISGDAAAAAAAAAAARAGPDGLDDAEAVMRTTPQPQQRRPGGGATGKRGGVAGGGAGRGRGQR